MRVGGKDVPPGALVIDVRSVGPVVEGRGVAVEIRVNEDIYRTLEIRIGQDKIDEVMRTVVAEFKSQVAESQSPFINEFFWRAEELLLEAAEGRPH
jgi:hypothetical protein